MDLPKNSPFLVFFKTMNQKHSSSLLKLCRLFLPNKTSKRDFCKAVKSRNVIGEHDHFLCHTAHSKHAKKLYSAGKELFKKATHTPSTHTFALLFLSQMAFLSGYHHQYMAQNMQHFYRFLDGLAGLDFCDPLEGADFNHKRLVHFSKKKPKKKAVRRLSNKHVDLVISAPINDFVDFSEFDTVNPYNVHD